MILSPARHHQHAQQQQQQHQSQQHSHSAPRRGGGGAGAKPKPKLVFHSCSANRRSCHTRVRFCGADSQYLCTRDTRGSTFLFDWLGTGHHQHQHHQHQHQHHGDDRCLMMRERGAGIDAWPPELRPVIQEIEAEAQQADNVHGHMDQPRWHGQEDEDRQAHLPQPQRQQQDWIRERDLARHRATEGPVVLATSYPSIRVVISSDRDGLGLADGMRSSSIKNNNNQSQGQGQDSFAADNDEGESRQVPNMLWSRWWTDRQRQHGYHHHTLHGVSISRDGRYLAAVHSDNDGAQREWTYLLVWDLEPFALACRAAERTAVLCRELCHLGRAEPRTEFARRLVDLPEEMFRKIIHMM